LPARRPEFIVFYLGTLSKRLKVRKRLRGLDEGSLPFIESLPDGGLLLVDTHTKRDQRHARWAREVFHSVLAVDLKGRGSATLHQLYHRLSWFMLPFNLGELLQILESARRSGLVERVRSERDALGREIAEEWSVTEEGRKLERPRALALPDMGRDVVGKTAEFSTSFSRKGVFFAVLPFATALIGLKFDQATALRLAAVLGGATLLAVTLWHGMLGDLKLQAAVLSWPRLFKMRPARYAYQLSLKRLFFLPALLSLLYVFVAIGVLIQLSAWKVALGFVAVGVLSLLFYWSSLRQLRKKWSHKAADRRLWEAKWRLRGSAGEIGALPNGD
jgi:hypothetical protein